MTSSNDKIALISGIDGYKASQIGFQVLQKDRTVRGTSRSIVAKDRLLCGAFRGNNLQFQHYEVKNSTVSGTFDEPVKGVHANIHADVRAVAVLHLWAALDPDKCGGQQY